MPKNFYFGCVKNPGHYLWTETLRKIYYSKDSGTPWEYGFLDSGLLPKNQYHECQAKITHKDGWTGLAFADYSVDRRPGSHSTFLFEGILTFEEAVARAKQVFPTIWARIRFPVVLSATP